MRPRNDLPINPGSLDTLLLSNENLLMKLAPGEGRKPLYFSRDKFMEELAYPCVFAGHCRDWPEDLSILKKSKSDILTLVLLNKYVYSKYRFSVLGMSTLHVNLSYIYIYIYTAWPKVLVQ